MVAAFSLWGSLPSLVSAGAWQGGRAAPAHGGSSSMQGLSRHWQPLFFTPENWKLDLIQEESQSSCEVLGAGG